MRAPIMASVIPEPYNAGRTDVRAFEFWDFCGLIVEIVWRFKIFLDNFAQAW